MALRHIVSWKLSGTTREQRDTQAVDIISVLKPLADSVSSVRALHLYRNELFDGENFDLTLVADFDDEAGLAFYAAHADHVAAIPVVKAHAIARTAVDFTV